MASDLANWINVDSRIPGTWAASFIRAAHRKYLANFFGVPEDTCFQSRYGGEPIVFKPDDAIRWHGTKPESLWHPYVWLGELGDRVDDETDDERSLRIWLELIDRGVLNTETGRFIDVLKPIGIDVSEETGRLAAWLDGEPDPILDIYTVSAAYPSLTEQPEGWALTQAKTMIGSFVGPVLQEIVDYAVELGGEAADTLEQMAGVETDEAFRTVLYTYLYDFATVIFDLGLEPKVGVDSAALNQYNLVDEKYHRFIDPEDRAVSQTDLVAEVLVLVDLIDVWCARLTPIINA